MEIANSRFAKKFILCEEINSSQKMNDLELGINSVRIIVCNVKKFVFRYNNLDISLYFFSAQKVDEVAIKKRCTAKKMRHRQIFDTSCS